METKFVDPQQNLVLQIWRQFRSVCLQLSLMLSQNRVIGERTTTILNMLSFLNILKDAVRGSVRGQNPTKKIVLSRLASASAAPGTLGQCKGAKKALGNVHRLPFYKRIGSLIDHDCGDNKNIQKAIFFDK